MKSGHTRLTCKNELWAYLALVTQRTFKPQVLPAVFFQQERAVATRFSRLDVGLPARGAEFALRRLPTHHTAQTQKWQVFQFYTPAPPCCAAPAGALPRASARVPPPATKPAPAPRAASTHRAQTRCVLAALLTGMPRHGTAMRGQKTADATCAHVGASISFARSGFSGRGACRSTCRAPGPCRLATVLSGRPKSPCPRPDIGPRPGAQPPWLCGARYRLAPAFPCVHLGPWRRPGHGPSEAPTGTVQQTGKHTGRQQHARKT